MPANGTRTLKVGSLVKRELALLIHNELRLPCARAVVITDVEVSRDLSTAKIYIHVAEGWQVTEVCQQLENTTGFLHTRLTSRTRLRSVPRLSFKADHSLEYGARIDTLLAKG